MRLSDYENGQLSLQFARPCGERGGGRGGTTWPTSRTRTRRPSSTTSRRGTRANSGGESLPVGRRAVLGRRERGRGDVPRPVPAARGGRGFVVRLGVREAGGRRRGRRDSGGTLCLMGANAKSHCSFSAVASSSSLSSIPDRRVTNSEADSSSTRQHSLHDAAVSPDGRRVTSDE